MRTRHTNHPSPPWHGLSHGVAAYILWGLLPIYWKQIQEVPSLEILTHRILWSTVFLFAVLVAQGKLPQLRAMFTSARLIAGLFGSSLLLAANWLAYIYAVNSGRILETSFAYFLTPLIHILFGTLILRERLRRAQTVSVGFAAAGVLYLAFAHGSFPGIVLCMAGSWGLYSLIRKVVHIDVVNGLFVESLLLSPIAAYYLASLDFGALAHGSTKTQLLLALAGAITAIPLLFYAAALHRLPLTTIAFLQYLAPSLQFFLGVFLYSEPLDSQRLTAFILVWTGLLIYTVDGAMRTQRAHARI